MLLRLPTLTEPRWHPDEALFTAIAWATSHGARLYAGVFDSSPPGIYWLYRLLLLVGAGSHHVIVQLTASLAVLVSVFLTVVLARHRLPGWAAWMAGFLTAFALSLPTLDGDILNVELAALPFFLGALALALRGGDEHGEARQTALLDVVAGALAALAVLIRPTFGLEVLVILAVVLQSRSWGLRLLSLATGGVAVLAAAVAELALTGSLSAYVTEVVPTDHGYLLMSNAGSVLPLVIRLGALVGLAAYLYYRTRRTRWWWYALWLPCTIAAASVTPRELTHYVHEAIPALAIGIAALSTALWPRRGWFSAPAMLLVMVTASEAVLILPAQQTAMMVAARAPAPLLHNFSYASLPTYYATWFGLVDGHDSPGTYQRLFPVDLQRISTEADLLRTMAAPNSRLLVIGGPPDLYIRSGLLPAGPFLILNTAYLNAPGADQVTEAAIASHKVNVVVLGSPPPWDPVNWSTLLVSNGFRQVASDPWPVYIATY